MTTHKENMLSCLVGMADIMASRWEETLDNDRDTQYAQTYAQICSAIVDLSVPKPFIQIGKDIIRRDDIIRAEILEENRSTYDNAVVNPKSIKVYLREIDASEDHGSWSSWRTYVYHSPEGQTLLEWLQGQSEVLMPYEDPLHIQPDYEDSVNRSFQEEE